MRRMLVIVNPYATGVSGRVRERALSQLAKRYALDVAETERPGHGIVLARDAARAGFDVVTALGGDGTVNEVANGLRAAHANGIAGLGGASEWAGAAPAGPAAANSAAARPALACLPGGQASIYARMLGMPTDMRGACAHLVELAERFTTRSVDLGVVNGRCFTFASGLGIDAAVTRQVDARPRLKARFGPWFYAWSVGSVLARRYLARAPRMAVRVSGADAATHGAASRGAEPASRRGWLPGRAGVPSRANSADRATGGSGADATAETGPSATLIEGLTTIVQNGSPFTYFKSRPIDLADGGALNSGCLAGCVLQRALPVDLPTLAWRALSSRSSVTAHRRVAGFTGATALSVSSPDGRPLPLHVDGDYIGDVTQARYSVLPAALDVLA